MKKHAMPGTQGKTPVVRRTKDSVPSLNPIPSLGTPFRRLFLLSVVFFFAFASSQTLQAQTIARQLVGGASGTVQQGDMQLSWSVGEMAVGHWVSKDGQHRLTEGFQQPTIQVELLKIRKDALISVAPNPVVDLLNITVLDARDDNLKITLTDQNGRVLVRRQALDLWKNEMDMSPYPAGVYFLQVHKGLRGDMQSYKVVKIQ